MTEIDRRWHLIEDLVRSVSPDRLQRMSPGDEARASGWTVAEVLLHMAGWKRRALESARRLARAPATPDDEINEKQFSDWRSYNDGHRERAAGVQIASVLSEHRNAHEELITAIAGLTDDDLLTAGEPRSWLRPLLAHTFDHLDPDLRPVLMATSATQGQAE